MLDTANVPVYKVDELAIKRALDSMRNYDKLARATEATAFRAQSEITSKFETDRKVSNRPAAW